MESRLGRFIYMESASGTQRIGGCVGPRAGLDAVLRGKTPSPCRESKTDHPARSPTLYHWAISAPISINQMWWGHTFNNGRPICTGGAVTILSLLIGRTDWHRALHHSERSRRPQQVAAPNHSSFTPLGLFRPFVHKCTRSPSYVNCGMP
jgi:hypothetical protein